MVWLRDYARPVLSSQHTCCEGLASFGRAGLIASASSLTSCATLVRRSQRRGLPPHFVANELGHPDGGSHQRLHGNPSGRGLCDQLRLAFGSWGEQRSRHVETCLEITEFRSVSHPPSPL